MKAAAVRVQEAVRRESAEPNLNIAVEPVDRGAVPASLTVIDTQRLLWALEALPHGVLEMHQKLKGLVQTSNNVATIVSEPQPERNRMRIVVGCLSRSSMEGRVQTTGPDRRPSQPRRATVEKGNSYPAGIRIRIAAAGIAVAFTASCSTGAELAAIHLPAWNAGIIGQTNQAATWTWLFGRDPRRAQPGRADLSASVEVVQS